MSSSSIQFHKIWIDQCAATEHIHESFGPENAPDCLIGEKVLLLGTLARFSRTFGPRCAKPWRDGPCCQRRGSGATSAPRLAVGFANYWRTSWGTPQG